jgi:hypothetical protein
MSTTSYPTSEVAYAQSMSLRASPAVAPMDYVNPGMVPYSNQNYGQQPQGTPAPYPARAYLVGPSGDMMQAPSISSSQNRKS